MTRLRLILGLLVLVVSLVRATAFGWPWNKDTDVAPASKAGNTDERASTTGARVSSSTSAQAFPNWVQPTDDDTPTASGSSLDDLVASVGASGSLELNASGTGDFIDGTAINLNATFAKPTNAISDIKSTYRNWVGPRAISPEIGCYREAHFMDTCPAHFDRHELTNTCWAECPLAYPVECGLECIRQNDLCIMDALNKVAAIGNTALAIATVGAAEKLWKVAKHVPQALDCVNMMIGTMRSILRYVRNIRNSEPTITTEKILNILYQSHNVVTDLPMAVYLCMGWPIPRSLDMGGRLLSTMNWILLNAIAYRDDIFLSWSKFKAFMIGANFTEAANKINETDIGTISDALASKSTCGYELRAVTDRTWNTVRQLRVENPGILEDDLRLKVQNTQIVTSDIAIATNNCMAQLIEESDEATAYRTREKIRTAFSGMINELVSKGRSDNGTSEDARQFMYAAVGKTLISIAVTGFDIIGAMGLIVTYMQKICGPTTFMGEIDDGTDPKTLGLTINQKAFDQSTISWTRKGDGAVIIDFSSTDTVDVTVNIMSGGNKVDDVELKAGGHVQWNTTVTALAGKTLYFSRWRPGFLGLPTTNGGTLLLWVPHASEGGRLDLHVKVNAT
ncbi:unnamed protein product [Peronospora destructor]|uniref:Uncharacterized protein n=1 Tax=Peronospora destructor TaxID=86335 RepID=A0AAV0UCY8_9STRA|nr:unnamed protein product [Peronospora destructor]